METAKLIKILIAGDGGQGVQAMAEILARAAFGAGRQVTLIPNYGLEQRGGMSLAYLQIGDEEIVYPRFSKPDILALMSEEVKERVRQYVFEDIKILDIKDIEKIVGAYGHTPSLNMFFLGLLTKILAEEKIITAEKVKEQILAKLGKKGGLEENLKAFEQGCLASF